MRVPQVNERVKEAPASALRAMFAGIGSLLFVRDKIKSKPAPEATSPEATASEAAAPKATSPEATSPEATADPETTAVVETPAEPETSAAPETAAAPATTAVAETAVAETTAASEVAAPVTAAAAPASEAAAALPLPNYDELSVASLRARLRNLSADQLTVLISYETSHADRADVITMFERRITKLALGLTQTLPKLTE
jgi:cytoskeletal protein RodZ